MSTVEVDCPSGDSPEHLSRRVFECMACDRRGLPFLRDSGGRFYRFPPTIGAVGQAAMLFIGINPRVSSSNRDLHEAVSGHWGQFESLRRNRSANRPYIGLNGLERHYKLHAEVARLLFPREAFDTVAAVTELHYCASSSSRGLPLETSFCADRYLAAVLSVVRPVVVFAVGVHVERTLRQHSCRSRSCPRGGLALTVGDRYAPVVSLPHPNAFAEKREPTARAVEAARTVLVLAGVLPKPV